MATACAINVRETYGVELTLTEDEARYLMVLVGRHNGPHSTKGDSIFEQLSDVVGDMPEKSGAYISTSKIEKELWDWVENGG